MYHDLQILNAEANEKNVRLLISISVYYVIKSGLDMLGIEALDRM